MSALIDASTKRGRETRDAMADAIERTGRIPRRGVKVPETRSEPVYRVPESEIWIDHEFKIFGLVLFTVTRRRPTVNSAFRRLGL